MRATGRRPHQLFLLSAAAWIGAAGGAFAHEPTRDAIPTSSLAALATRVPAGEVVYVTDVAGVTVKGRLRSATAAGLQLSTGSGVRDVPASKVRRVDRQQDDSPLTGALIGAGIGAIPGIYRLIADPNECAGLCREDYAAIAAGAAIGGLIDSASHKRVTVYLAGLAAAKQVTIAPLLRPGRHGLQMAVKF